MHAYIERPRSCTANCRLTCKNYVWESSYQMRACWCCLPSGCMTVCSAAISWGIQEDQCSTRNLTTMCVRISIRPRWTGVTASSIVSVQFLLFHRPHCASCMLELCAAAADILLTPPPPIVTDRRAAAAATDRMSTSRRRRFRDVFTSCCTSAICC